MVAELSTEPLADVHEQQLILQAQAGDSGAWERLIRPYQAAVFRLAYLLLHNAADAEDVAQEALVQAYLKLETVDAERPFRPWLLRITRNRAYNHQRSLKRYMEMTRRFLQQRDETSAPNHARQVAAEMEAELLWQAVRRLRKNEQEIIYLRYFLQLSEAETAATLAVPVGTVKSRTARALKTLRGIIEREFPALSVPYE